METILNQLLSLATETEVVEFKEAKHSFDVDKLGKYFSALSNEANLKGLKNAWLLMGVKNDKSIVGTQISDEKINEYKKEIVQHTSPRCGLTAVHKVVKDEKLVLMFEIPASPKGMPLAWKGHKYGRDGESIGPLSDIEYDTIKAQTNSTDWSAQIIKGANHSDLSAEAIAFACLQFAEKNPKLKDDIAQWSDEVFLNKAKITIKSQITNTAILLLGKPVSAFYLNPSTSRITWILKGADNVEKDYEHFESPLLLAVEQVGNKIRNLTYRYIKDGKLFPDEVEQYDPYIIREALNNCIAHQDYTLGSKIVVVENEAGTLTFSNAGNFIPHSVEDVITSDAPEPRYRNTFLTDAMVNLNMIDTIGSGIKRMFNIQRKKFFPLPDYDFSNHKVQVTITGKVVDLNYARKLAQMPNLSLAEIVFLDKVAKGKALTGDEVKILKSKGLIEGRKPNFHIAANVAAHTGNKVDYMKQRGIDDSYCQKMIIDYLDKFEKGAREDFEKFLLDRLPNILNISQKKNKIKNNLQTLRKNGIIISNGNTWQMSKPG